MRSARSSPRTPSRISASVASRVAPSRARRSARRTAEADGCGADEVTRTNLSRRGLGVQSGVPSDCVARTGQADPPGATDWMDDMRIVALAGGIGGARFLRGLRAVEPEAEITAVVNTGDDLWLHGLKVCPDLDTVMYTLGGGISQERGWGREDESFVVQEELSAYGVGPDWFGLGDRDLATHLVRTQMLNGGYPLSQVTLALCDRWKPGVRLLPMTDDRVETHVVVDLPGSADQPGGRRAIHFQQWWLQHRAQLPAERIFGLEVEKSSPAPGVLDAIRDADIVLLPPSNPVVSIGTILAVPGIRDAIRSAQASVVGVSRIVGGAPVRGMADACLAAIG